MAQAARLLNDFTLDFVIGARSPQMHDAIASKHAMKREFRIGLNRMVMSHLALNLAKWAEFYDHYKDLFPKNLKASARAIYSRIRSSGVKDFRDKVVGHVIDTDSGRPLLKSEIDGLLTRIIGSDEAAFLLWINNPTSPKRSETVVGVSEDLRGFLATASGYSQEEIYAGVVHGDR